MYFIFIYFYLPSVRNTGPCLVLFMNIGCYLQGEKEKEKEKERTYYGILSSSGILRTDFRASQPIKARLTNGT